MSLRAALLAVSAVLLLVVLVATTETPGHVKLGGRQVENGRATFSLRNRLMGFDRFKRIFKKTYKSALEELVRLKHFLARLVRAFISATRYKRGDSSSYLAINHLSDWTDLELRRLMLPRQLAADKRIKTRRRRDLVVSSLSEQASEGEEESLIDN